MTYGVSLVRTDRGRRIAVTREVAAAPDVAWRLLAEVGRWSEWGPPVTDVEYPEPAVTEGTGGRVRVLGLLWVPFTVETVGDRSWTWTVRGLTPPADGHRVEALGEDRSRVVLELPLWAPWYVPLCLLATWLLARIAAAEAAPTDEPDRGRPDA